MENFNFINHSPTSLEFENSSNFKTPPPAQPVSSPHPQSNPRSIRIQKEEKTEQKSAPEEKEIASSSSSSSSASSPSDLIERNHLTKHTSAVAAVSSSRSSPTTGSNQADENSSGSAIASMLLQRTLFLLAGVAIAALFFHAIPASFPKADLPLPVRRAAYEVATSEAVDALHSRSARFSADRHLNFGGKVIRRGDLLIWAKDSVLILYYIRTILN